MIDYEPQCLRDLCREPRWKNYDGKGGNSCMCQAHTEEVLRGERRAPPLRQRIDYQAVGRKTFLVEILPDFPIADKDPDPTLAAEAEKARETLAAWRKRIPEATKAALVEKVLKKPGA